MKKTITLYSDPSHGWAKVKRKELEKLGILNKITNYSYQRNDFVYLEEDQDLKTYLDTLKHNGLEFEIHWIDSSRSSKIRNYERFSL